MDEGSSPATGTPSTEHRWEPGIAWFSVFLFFLMCVQVSQPRKGVHHTSFSGRLPARGLDATRSHQSDAAP
jgi:hypothetical protein